MQVRKRTEALEKAAAASNNAACTVLYKAAKSSRGEVRLPISKALEAAQRGELVRIYFDLSFDEQQAQRAAGADILASLFEEVDGIRRDDGSQTAGADRALVLCSKPVIFAKQAPPKNSHGHLIGGNFVTEDGEEFHQSQWKDLLERRGAGFIIVPNYDESKEPWFSK